MLTEAKVIDDKLERMVSDPAIRRRRRRIGYLPRLDLTARRAVGLQLRLLHHGTRVWAGVRGGIRTVHGHGRRERMEGVFVVDGDQGFTTAMERWNCLVQRWTISRSF